MHRRTFFAALGGLVATTVVAHAQTTSGIPVLGDALGLGGDALGAGLALPGDILGIGAGGLDATGGGFRAADLMGGEYSIETSKMALQRARSQAVRDFAQLEINEQVSVAAALGATPGSVAPRPDQQAMVAKLAATRAGAFDHAYIMGQIKGHNELLAVNTQAISAAPSTAVRRVATLAVPTIQTHLAILHRLRAGLPAV
jgi:putative membrane protein